MRVIFQAVQRAGSITPIEVAKALEGTTFETVYGSSLMRKEDHQLVVPNFFGQVRMVDGVLKPAITMSVPPEQAMPPPDGSCKLSA
jgi:branched-chain amino acid transport system substrate-binding protein